MRSSLSFVRAQLSLEAFCQLPRAPASPASASSAAGLTIRCCTRDSLRRALRRRGSLRLSRCRCSRSTGHYNHSSFSATRNGQLWPDGRQRPIAVLIARALPCLGVGRRRDKRRPFAGCMAQRRERAPRRPPIGSRLRARHEPGVDRGCRASRSATRTTSGSTPTVAFLAITRRLEPEAVLGAARRKQVLVAADRAELDVARRARRSRLGHHETSFAGRGARSASPATRALAAGGFDRDGLGRHRSRAKGARRSRLSTRSVGWCQ